MSRRPSTSGRFAQSRSDKPFWLFQWLWTLLIAVVAYFVAASIFLLVTRVSQIPRGPLWDEAFRAPLLFVLMVIAIVFLLVPRFQEESDQSLKTFSLFATIFLIAYALLKGTHIGNPDYPLDVAQHYIVDPLRHSLGY